MPSYYVSSYTDSSITLTITPSGDDIYFKVYCRTTGGTELENTWIAATATRNYTIYGLSAGTTYVVNVGYNTSATEGTCTWMGSTTVTTTGGSSSGGGGGDDSGDSGETTTYYYLTLAYNMNGGTGGPSGVILYDTTQWPAYTLPTTVPTREGYTFVEWEYDGYPYYPGRAYKWYAASSVYPGYTATLTAVWEEAGGGVRVHSGGWQTATPYVWYNGAWHKATPYIHNGSTWKKGS